MAKEKPGVEIVKLLRRKYPRFLLNLPLEYFSFDSNIRHPGHAENGSEGGLKVYLPGWFKAGENLGIKVFFTLGTELQTIESTVQVVWADLRPEQKENQYGVKIIDISSEDNEKWKMFLSTLSP
jgi:c-di-GMP-binding flagellar brake protein YcgR